jgi:hypothetical protein
MVRMTHTLKSSALVDLWEVWVLLKRREEVPWKGRRR